MKTAVFALILSCCTFTAASAADYAGVAKTVRGTATANRSDTAVSLQPGTRLEEGDVIKTGPDGYLGLTMRDDTLLTLGPNTTFSLEKYTFDPKTHDGSFAASVTRGVVYVVTGLIPKKSPDAFVVKTGVSTMGVRGTEFIVEVE